MLPVPSPAHITVSGESNSNLYLYAHRVCHGDSVGSTSKVPLFSDARYYTRLLVEARAHTADGITCAVGRRHLKGFLDLPWSLRSQLEMEDSFHETKR